MEESSSSQYSALLLAVAGMTRLNLSHRISYIIPPESLLPAVGQGSLAVECRSHDMDVLQLIQGIDDWETRIRCEAEREMLRVLEGGCSVPVGVWTDIIPLTSSSSSSFPITTITPTTSTVITTTAPESTTTTTSSSSLASPPVSSSSTTTPSTDYLLKINACVTSLNGQNEARAELNGNIGKLNDWKIGVKKSIELGKQIAEMVWNQGGKSILEEIHLTRHIKDMENKQQT